MHIRALGGILALSAAVSGCQSMGSANSGQFVSAEPPELKSDRVASGMGANSSAGSWQLPFQLTPITTRKGVESVTAFVPQSGFVTGKPDVVARIGQPLVAAPGVNRTVQTCRNTVASKATDLGARDVEAVSMGPDKRDRKGVYTGPVKVRVTYQNSDLTFQVVEADMICSVNAKNAIVNAVAVDGT